MYFISLLPVCVCIVSVRATPEVNEDVKYENKGSLLGDTARRCDYYAVGDDDIIGPVIIPDKMLYFGKLYGSVYVSMNGFLSLGTERVLYIYPPKSPSTFWDMPPLVAPLWTDLDTSEKPDSGLCVSVIRDQTSILKIQNSISRTYNCSDIQTALVAKWRNIIPRRSSSNKYTKPFSFDVIIATSNFRSYLLVDFHHDMEQRNWFPDVFESVFSVDNNHFGHLAFTDHQVIDVTGNPPMYITARASCMNFAFNKTLRQKIDRGRKRAQPCPCTEFFAQHDASFWKKRNCYETILPTKGTRQRCCYDSYGGLEVGSPSGGFTFVGSLEKEINEMYRICCRESESCDIFYRINPSDDCEHYSRQDYARAWGDPALTTLDGQRFFFNGRGEYIFFNDSIFMVQIRTELVKMNSTDATEIVAVALKEYDSDAVEVIRNRNHILVLVNSSLGMNIPVESSPETKVFRYGNSRGAVLIRNGYISLHSGNYHFAVKIRLPLDIELSVPVATDSTGLVGTHDNNTNDFRLRNITVPDPNATEEELFRFGQSWMLRDVSESCFTYNKTIAGLEMKQFEFYNNKSIQPSTFLTDIVKHRYLKDKPFRDLFRDICQSDDTCFTNITDACQNFTVCYIDTLVYGDISYGVIAKANQERLEKERRIRENKTPRWTNAPYSINLFRGKSVSYDLRNMTTDDDHTNKLTFKIAKNAAGHIENRTHFVLTLDSSYRNTTTKVVVVVTDELNATARWTPKIYFCGCRNRAECLFNTTINSSVKDKFYRVYCNCTGDWSGDFCEKPPKCTKESCFQHRCYDSSIIERKGTLCEPCPQGYSGDGRKCEDIDDCKSNPCEHGICHNYVSYYNCTCASGYEGLNCAKDKDECDAAPCDHVCNNTEGSFICTCRQGYTLEKDNKTCREMVFRLPRQNFLKEIEAGINTQISLQLFVGYTYHSMYIYFDRDDVALKGFAKFFKKSSDKTREHAEEFMKYQNKRGGRVVFSDIKRPAKDEWSSGLEAMKTALELEKSVNNGLLDLHTIASKHGDAQMVNFIASKFLGNQVESIKEILDHITNLKRAGPGLGEFMFDKQTLDVKSTCDA